jgi:LmbE family N-acetylglucosaminyl deacetylase
MRRSTAFMVAAAALAATLGALAPALAQPAVPQGDGERRLALRKLSVLASVLYVGAHPDDENTAMLAYLANERLARTAYLSLTRGDGGQNLIGTEQGELLGLIRTEELLAARRIDGAEQLFTRTIDFGYSKSPEETLAIWGREAALADVVWAIRWFRPDVIVTRFPANGDGGHGQHTASAILAREAFTAAADPARFPEQLSLVRPWHAKRLLWNGWRRDGDTRPVVPGTIQVDLGTYSPALGQAYTELAAAGRSMHKSQGFGSRERRGSLPNDLEPIVGEPPAGDLLDGVDATWGRVAGGAAVAAILAEAEAAYDPRRPEAIVPLLVQALAALDRAGDDPWVAIKRAEIADVIRSCTGLWLEAVGAAATAVPRGELKVTTTAINRSSTAVALKAVALPYIRSTTWGGAPAALENNRPMAAEWTLALPATIPPSQPHWLERPHGDGMYEVADPRLVATPRTPPALTAEFTVTVAGRDLTFREPVVFRATDPVEGERSRPVAIVPRVVVALSEGVLVFGDGAAKRVRAIVTGNAAVAAAAARLRVPAGWRAEPESVPLALAVGRETTAEFTLHPPAGASEGSIEAVVEAEGESYSRGAVTVDHRHIPVQTVLRPARARVLRIDLRHDGRRIGYVMGAGDEVPGVLRQLSYEVTLLSEEDLAGAALDRFDAIVTGVRAYNTRSSLRQAQPRLLEYVRGGGTLVVQYNVARELVADQLGPLPLKLSRDRVTEENAPVELTAPDHLLLTTPNRIGAADFAGWVQERGLYFASEWDAAYETVIATHDTGEKPLAGAILFARHGKGAYVHTSLAFFRQLPAGVPGAIRLFANLLAAKGGV